MRSRPISPPWWSCGLVGFNPDCVRHIVQEISIRFLDLTNYHIVHIQVIYGEKSGSICGILSPNKRLPGLQVRKIDGTTKQPLGGAKFRVEKGDGRQVGDLLV